MCCNCIAPTIQNSWMSTRNAKQLLLSDEFTSSTEHGGEYSRGRRKSRRPVSTRDAMHLTLRSSYAVGKRSFHQKELACFIKSLLQASAKRYGIRIYSYSINPNHLHILLKTKTKGGFKAFLRNLAGKIAQKATGAKKGCAFGKRFFDQLAFTRIVKFGRDFRGVAKYIFQNIQETLGLIAYQPRTHRFRRRIIPAPGKVASEEFLSCRNRSNGIVSSWGTVFQSVPFRNHST